MCAHSQYGEAAVAQVNTADMSLLRVLPIPADVIPPVTSSAVDVLTKSSTPLAGPPYTNTRGDSNFQSINAMPAYSGHSLSELRWKAYARRLPPNVPLSGGSKDAPVVPAATHSPPALVPLGPSRFGVRACR